MPAPGCQDARPWSRQVSSLLDSANPSVVAPDRQDQQMKRQNRGMFVLDKQDGDTVKQWLPYGLDR